MLGLMGHVKDLAILSLGQWTVIKAFYILQCVKLCRGVEKEERVWGDSKKLYHSFANVRKPNPKWLMEKQNLIISAAESPDIEKGFR